MKYLFPKGSKNPNWKGGQIYIGTRKALLRPDHPYAMKSGYVLESRLIVEKDLGRYLLPHEKVHHINGDGFDNRLENLVVLSQKVHMQNHINPNSKYYLFDDRRWLEQQFLTLNKTASQIAKYIGCHKSTIQKVLGNYGLTRIKPHPSHKILFPALRDKEWLSRKRKTMSGYQIAKILKCHNRTVYRSLKRLNID